MANFEAEPAGLVRGRRSLEVRAHGFVPVPATILPCGTGVPAFAVARWLAACGADGRVVVCETAPPWVNIDYHAARAVCSGSGLALLTELQYLAIALDLSRQAVNWSGGAVGRGRLFQGLHLGGERAQPGVVEPHDPRERRWHVLSNGERLHDFAGNAFSWVFDDVQGDADGVVARAFAPASPTVSSAPGASLDQGLGWWPRAGNNWQGKALARGGAWCSGEGAGIYAVIDEKPRSALPYVGFRCTLPL